MRKKFNKKTFFTLLLLFPISFLSKIYQFTFLSEKSFTDSNYIIQLMQNNIENKGTAFYITAEFFKKINIFHFTTIAQWNITISILFTFLLFILLLKNKKYKFTEYLFLFLTFVLLNFYVFNISKDIIQLFIFLIIYLIIVDDKKSDIKKLIFVGLIFLLEAIWFRPYYILIDYAFFISYFVLNLFIKHSHNANKKKTILILFLALFVFLLPISLTKIFYFDGYSRIVNVRDSITSILNANTEITNLISGDNFIIFSINYIINGIRIFFPLELLLKSITYLPFVFYQLLLTFLTFINVKHLNNKNIIPLAIILGYFLGSIIYEPDFGSVVRHETTLIMIFVFMNRLFYGGAVNEDIANRDSI